MSTRAPAPFGDLKSYEDPTAWDTLEWIDFVERVTPRLKKDPETTDPELHGLRRFLRIGVRLGWLVPRQLYTSRTQPRDRFRVAAASTVILAEDRTSILRDSQSAFVEDPILSQAAPLATSMFLELPLRSSEVFAQICECVDRSTHSVAIQDGIHSHLKSANGRRLIVAPEPLIAALDTYVRDCRTESQYLFLDDGGFNWDIANEIQRWLTDAFNTSLQAPMREFTACDQLRRCESSFRAGSHCAVVCFAARPRRGSVPSGSAASRLTVSAHLGSRYIEWASVRP
jgi:hypothetical protein